MKITSTAKGMKMTPALQKRVETKLGKFDRYFGDEASATAKFTPNHDKIKVEVTMKIRNRYYRGETEGEDAFTALDKAMDVMEGQIRKHKTRIERRIRTHSHMKDYLKDQTIADQIEEDLPRIIKQKSFEISPMDPEEATLQMELLGHSFLLFLNADNNNKVNLVYKRKDGNYGLIDPLY